MHNANIHNTFGAAFIGITASSFIFGILSMQCYTYYHRYPLDRPFYKILVRLTLSPRMLEATHSALISHFFYYYVIVNWGMTLAIIKQPIIWSVILLQVVTGAVVGTIVRGCFAMRVWRFSNNNVWVTSAIVLSTLIQLGMETHARAFKLNTNHGIDRIMVAIVALGLGVLTDVLTAVSISWYLRKLKTGYKNSDSLVNKLIAYAINTGLVTSIISIACLITYGTMPGNFIFISLYFVLSKLYANSFLATLNTRLVLKGRGTDNGHETVPTFLMVETHTIPPLPHHASDDVYSAGGKVRISSLLRSVC
ncbi:hypothetical protein BDM02DRAFT_3096964 [Thelephora ganbajun]|uniref:Uncharacterized protein n=1 Tax=Thelephora ganbajun TaxID=370292 RepID=A0ACB6ZEK5_THEGA|nr:hypothetical protein BDM02DRAFT_3096964 [Thelephora ganbajun]